MSQIEIPRYVDDPPHILLWSADEVAPILLALVFGIIFSHTFIFLLAGVALTKVYSRFRDGRPDGYIMHLIYWYGFLPIRARSIPNPFARRFHN